jgi:AbiV family abortive infection protein
MVEQNNRNIYLEIYNAGNKNASNLLKAANSLYAEGLFAQAYTMAYIALEEISKAQFAADVFTGLRKEDEFKKFYRDHKSKIAGVEWAHYDASTYPHKMKWFGPDMDDVEEMTPEMPGFDKRQAAMYVDIDFDKGIISKPFEAVSEKDAQDVIHIVEVAFERIWEVTGEFGGNQIGTKGFMK